MLSCFKPAKLYNGARQWYVYYHYINPVTGKYQRFKEYFDINRIHSKKDRLLYGNEMVKFINKKLAMGFNPFQAMKQKNSASPAKIIQQFESVITNLSNASSPSMMKYYKTMANRFIYFVKAKQMEHYVMMQIDVDTCEAFKDYLVETGLAKKTVNVTLSHMRLFWRKARRLKLVEDNPFTLVENVKRVPKKGDEKDVFEPLTFAEMELIFNYLDKHGLRDFKRYLAMIYYQWIRPVEISRLSVGDINLKEDIIHFKKANTKNNTGAMIQIVPQLKQLLIEMNLDNYPTEKYLFSGNYLPGDEQLTRQPPMRLWNKIVVRTLKIDKRMYALKHTGNIEYLLKNKNTSNLKWQQMQNRHHSSVMTERYNRQLGAYFIDLSSVNFHQI